jgi:hypothetical protein
MQPPHDVSSFVPANAPYPPPASAYPAPTGKPVAVGFYAPPVGNPVGNPQVSPPQQVQPRLVQAAAPAPMQFAPAQAAPNTADIQSLQQGFYAQQATISRQAQFAQPFAGAENSNPRLYGYPDTQAYLARPNSPALNYQRQAAVQNDDTGAIVMSAISIVLTAGLLALLFPELRSYLSGNYYDTSGSGLDQLINRAGFWINLLFIDLIALIPLGVSIGSVAVSNKTKGREDTVGQVCFAISVLSIVLCSLAIIAPWIVILFS